MVQILKLVPDKVIKGQKRNNIVKVLHSVIPDPVSAVYGEVKN